MIAVSKFTTTWTSGAVPSVGRLSKKSRKSGYSTATYTGTSTRPTMIASMSHAPNLVPHEASGNAGPGGAGGYGW